MRRVALVVLLASGCTTYKGSVRTAQVGGVMLVGGVAVVGIGVENQTSSFGTLIVAAYTAFFGLDLLIGGLVGMAIHDGPDDDERTPPLPPGRVMATRKRVRGMSPEEHARCMEQRRERLIAAQRIDDAKRRGEAITAIGACGTIEEVEIEVSAETGETAEETLARRERAWAQTKRAGEAARAGDCATVLALGREVHASDREFHDTVFARDVAIARCLWPEPATAAP